MNEDTPADNAAAEPAQARSLTDVALVATPVAIVLAPVVDQVADHLLHRPKAEKPPEVVLPPGVEKE